MPPAAVLRRALRLRGVGAGAGADEDAAAGGAAGVAARPMRTQIATTATTAWLTAGLAAVSPQRFRRSRLRAAVLRAARLLWMKTPRR
jgi:hypothetical protein